MTRTSDRQRQLLELNNRQFIQFPPLPQHIQAMGIEDRSFGVSLNNEEAQVYINCGLNVYCDEGGPFLVVVVRYGEQYPQVWSRQDINVVIEPFPWTFRDKTGVTCYLESIQ